MLNRRGLLSGMLATLAAPAIIRTPGLLMPIKPVLFINKGAITQTIAEVEAINAAAYNTRGWFDKSTDEIVVDVEKLLRATWDRYKIAPEADLQTMLVRMKALSTD